jgi:integrase
MARLTKRTVDAAQPQASDYFVWDGDLAGFGLRVMPSRRKSYVVQYRAGGRTRRVGLGVHGAVTPDQARKRAQDLLGAVARGEDPAEEIRTHRRAPTVAALCDRFLAEHVAHRCKPSTQGEYRRSVDLFIKPRIGNLKLPDIKRADIARLHHELRDIPYQANRTLGVLSKMFNLAELWGLMADGANPCRHVKKYPERKRERFLSPEEYRRLWSVLAELETERPAMRPALNAIRLLLLTGCRLSEIQTLRWEHVRETALELPDGKTGARKVPLCPEAIAVLGSIERLSDNPYVITGTKPGQHLTDLERPWRRIRARAGLDEVRIHDLRHSFASAAVANGESMPMIGKLLGHKQVQTTARYAHLDDNPVHAAAGRVGGAIALAIRGGCIDEAPAR